MEQVKFFERRSSKPQLKTGGREALPPLRTLPGYERDSLATGVDIDLHPGEDLVTTNSGDLALATGAKMIQEALARRLATPLGGYTRHVPWSEKWVTLDEGYGNPLYEYLSSYHAAEEEQVVKEVIAAASLEPRIDEVKLEYIRLNNEQARLELTLRYRIKSNEELYNLNLTFQQE